MEMANRKNRGKMIEYLTSEECMKKCDSIPIYNMIFIARLFLSEANYAKSLNLGDEET